MLALTSDTNRSTNPSSSERMSEERSSTSAFNNHPLDPDAASNPTTLHPSRWREYLTSNLSSRGDDTAVARTPRRTPMAQGRSYDSTNPR